LYAKNKKEYTDLLPQDDANIESRKDVSLLTFFDKNEIKYFMVFELFKELKEFKFPLKK
jgi:hypothetical protein